ncbi:hypothetical protein ABPG75_004755 [Micractinium tetrahymenae]
MSRGRTGLIKALKEVFREVKFFGDAEISTLKKELEAHKLQLEQLRAQRAEMARREEQLALLEMRKAVEHLQHMEGLLAEQDQRLEAAAEQLAQRVRTQQERNMTRAALKVVQGTDMENMLFSEEAELRQQLDKLQADLQAAASGMGGSSGAGSGAPSAAPGSGGKKRR